MKPEFDTQSLRTAIEAEILHLKHQPGNQCLVTQAGVEFVPALPAGWVRVHLDLKRPLPPMRLYGGAEELLTCLKKRNSGRHPCEASLTFWQNLGSRTPPRLHNWPGAEVIWSSLPDAEGGSYKVYALRQNSGWAYLAGYENAGTRADEGWEYHHLAPTPRDAAAQGFPLHWDSGTNPVFDGFPSAMEAIQAENPRDLLMPADPSPPRNAAA